MRSCHCCIDRRGPDWRGTARRDLIPKLENSMSTSTISLSAPRGTLQLLAALSVLTFGTAAGAQECRLEYQRAENGSAASSRSTNGAPGIERLTLRANQQQEFANATR